MRFVLNGLFVVWSASTIVASSATAGALAGSAPAARLSGAGAGAVTRQVLLRRDGLDNEIPFAEAGYLGWQENSHRYPFDYNLFVKRPDGTVSIINAAHTDVYGGSISGNTVVYSEASDLGGVSHLKLFDLTTAKRASLGQLDTRGGEYHPTMCGDWILFTRGPRSGTTRVLLYNLATRKLRELASLANGVKRGYVYSGQVNGDYATWGRVTPKGQDVFLYRISTTTTVRVQRPRGVFAQYDPAVTPTGTLYFEQSGSSCRPVVKLVRRARNGVQRVLVKLRSGVDGGYMFAFVNGTTTSVLYSRFSYSGCEISTSSGYRAGPGSIYTLIDSP